MSRFSTTNTPWWAFRICGHLERALRVLGGDRAVAPGVAAGERDAALGEPVGELAAGAGLALDVGVGVLPVRAPAGVEQHGVARRRLEPVERRSTSARSRRRAPTEPGNVEPAARG